MKTHQQRHQSSQRLTPLRSFKQRERRYPIWSVRSTVATFLIGLGITALLVVFLGKKSLIAELETTLGIVAAGLFLFLAIGLYRGARVRKNETIAGDLKLYNAGDGPSPDWGASPSTSAVQTTPWAASAACCSASSSQSFSSCS